MKLNTENTVWQGKLSGLLCMIKPHPLRDSGLGGLNGYCTFPKRSTREAAYHGILTYVPVHGGITYAEEHDERMTYGFNAGHHDSEKYPINDVEWVKDQIEVMIKGIRLAATVEAKYLRCISNKGRAKYADMVQAVGTAAHRFNFGVGIALLSGKL